MPVVHVYSSRSSESSGEARIFRDSTDRADFTTECAVRVWAQIAPAIAPQVGKSKKKMFIWHLMTATGKTYLHTTVQLEN